MSRFTRVLASLRCSVPPSDQARLLAAMEGGTPSTPVVGAWGSASAAGETPAATGAGSTPPVVAGHAPEGEEQELITHTPVRRGSEHADRASPSGPPTCETDLFWEPTPDARWDLSRVGSLLDRWKKEQG